MNVLRVKMSGHMLLVVVVVTLVLLLTVTEGVVVGHRPPTNDLASDLANCSQSVKLVPLLRFVTPDPTTSPSFTSATFPLPHTTTQTLFYTQPHGTTHPSTPTTTTHHPQQPTTTTPTLPKTHTTHHGRHKATQHLEKHDTNKFDRTQDSPLTTTEKKPQLSSYSPVSTRVPPTSTSSSFNSYFFSFFSFTTPTAPPPVTVPRPNLPPHTSTLPPPSLTLPLPTAPPFSTTPTPISKLQQVGKKLKNLLSKQIPLAVTSGWAKKFQRPYLQRIRAANHELVDKILQTEYDDYEPSTSHGNTTTCSLPEKRLAHLFHQQTLLLLLLQALPQSLEEVEEAMWNPEITDYIFRPEKKAVFDVYGCNTCYALDASGVCREVFFCKNGQNAFSRIDRRRRIG